MHRAPFPCQGKSSKNIVAIIFNNPSISFNQDGLLDDKDLIKDAIKQANKGEKPPQEIISQSTISIPAYTIPTYSSSVQSWITASANGATRDQVVKIDISQGRNTKWEDYGFKEVHGGGGVDFWPFFFAEVKHNGQWEKRELKTEGREDSIGMHLAAIGLQRFDIQAGQW
jgi:hypothetical protein